MALDSSRKVHVLGVVGSPRRGGNTDILVDAVLAGAERAGAESGKIYLSQLNIKPCRACEGCKKAGRCVNDDDMRGVLKQMEQSPIWVLGTPVYFWGPTGWFKAFMDRWYGAREQINFAEKRAILTIPFEDTKTATARHTVGMVRDALDYLKTPLLTSIVVPGVLNKGDVNRHEEILAAARRAGYDAVVGHSAASGAE